MNENIENFESIEKNLEYFKEHHKEVYEAYEKYGKLGHEKGDPLEEKTRWLIKVALSAEAQYEYALRTHILKALKADCTKEEIEHAILLVGPSCGFPRMMYGLMIPRQVFESGSY